jgi:hypothetical protein
MGRLPMPPIQLDHIAIALPRIAEAPSVLVAVLGGLPSPRRPSGVFPIPRGTKEATRWTF